jgi:hypothetical protein
MNAVSMALPTGFTQLSAHRIANLCIVGSRWEVQVPRAHSEVEVLRRAEWDRLDGSPPAVRPERGTWCAFKGPIPRDAIEAPIVPLIGCPACGDLLILVPSLNAMRLLGLDRIGMERPVHEIDSLGRVHIDVFCKPPCEFRRVLLLDQWNKLKPLYATIVKRRGQARLETVYSHAASPVEARRHLGLKADEEIIETARAVGFVGKHGDELAKVIT